jgi:REP element-mobilizing transposase RayT
LPEVVHRFKTLTTTRYIAGVKELGWPGFRGRVWQRNYYEHIVRDEAALAEIRQYIAMNPARWEQDEENPQGTRG